MYKTVLNMGSKAWQFSKKILRAIGEEPALAAEWRRGLKDLQNAVLDPWNGFSATHEESGTIANPTQQLVTQDIQGERGGRGVHGPEKQVKTEPSKEPEQEQKPEGKLKSMLKNALGRCGDRSEDRSAERDMEMEH